MPDNQDFKSALREAKLERAKKFINDFELFKSQVRAEGYNLLCDALKDNHVEVIILLLTKKPVVNSKKTKPSNTPLHFAVTNGEIEIIKTIIDKGANINAKNQNGRTPLHNAIEYKKMEVIELLLEYGADVNATDNHGSSPLHDAIKYAKREVIDLLLKKEADVNSADNHGSSILHLAVQRRSSKIIEQLLKFRACVNCTDSSTKNKGYSPLHFAVERGSKKVTTLLLTAGAAVDVQGKDSLTPLHIAARKGYMQIAEDLLKHCANIYSLTLEGYTPLHFASEQGTEEIVKLLLNKGADVNASTMGNLTPVHIATEKGHKIIVKLLLQHGAKVDSQDDAGNTILHLAVEQGHLVIVQEILKYSPDINNQGNRRVLQTSILGHGEKYKMIVEALLEYGFIVVPEGASNPELLHAAVKNGCLKIVEDLLKSGADVNTLHNSIFAEDLTPLHTAVIYKQEEVAKLLISYQAHINAQSKTRKTPIFYAVENVDLNIIKLLLSNRANVKDDPELLNVAVQKECIEIVEVLLQHGADINACDKDGRTALHFSALSKSEDFGFHIAKLLLRKGANVDIQTKDGTTSLNIAIERNCAKIVEVLLEYNANVNPRIENVILPLHLSAEKGHEEISVMLLKKGANVNAKQDGGKTALYITAEKGFGEVLKILLEVGAEVDSKSEFGITALHLAAVNGHWKIIETILKFGADINLVDKYGRTALHFASKRGHSDIVKTLLEYGSDINIINSRSFTPFDNAIENVNHSREMFYEYFPDGNYDDDPDCNYYPYKETVDVLKRHVVKLKTANLYVSDKNFLMLLINSSDEMDYFLDECGKEIASMTDEKINHTNISFYDILTKGTMVLAIFMRNENIVHVRESGDYETKFPIYASMIKSNFRKGMERKELEDQGNKVFGVLLQSCSELPYDCTDKIFSYLNNKELKFLIDACKSCIC